MNTVVDDQDISVRRNVVKRQAAGNTQHRSDVAVKGGGVQRTGCASGRAREPHFSTIWEPGQALRGAVLRRKRGLVSTGIYDRRRPAVITKDRMVEKRNTRAVWRHPRVANPSTSFVHGGADWKFESVAAIDDVCRYKV